MTIFLFIPMGLILDLSLKVFPSIITSGNVSVVDHSITYQFQVSASTNFDGTPNEGELSTITANTTLFIPMPGTKAAIIQVLSL